MTLRAFTFLSLADVIGEWPDQDRPATPRVRKVQCVNPDCRMWCEPGPGGMCGPVCRREVARAGQPKRVHTPKGRRGMRPGSPSRLTPEQARAILADRIAGAPRAAVAAKHGLPAWYITHVTTGHVMGYATRAERRQLAELLERTGRHHVRGK